MSEPSQDQIALRRRAEAEIALAKASGAKRAYADAGYRVVIVEQPDGSIDKIRLPSLPSH